MLNHPMHFRITGQEIATHVVSLRSLERDSFRADFFILSSMGSWRAIRRPGSPPSTCTGRKPLLAELVRDYPSVTALDIDALMTTVREITDRVVLAGQYMFLFTFGAGLAVLCAAIQATQDERFFELVARRGSWVWVRRAYRVPVRC